jgi:23S rRNA (cytidine1920-2'-O)/16S rRNA (cytidine1409-2'-O)-methyltransferase
MTKLIKVRADDLLVTLGLAESKSQAQALIIAGKVWLKSERIQKPGKSFSADTVLELEAPLKFVSRGGDKLESFLNAFPISLKGKRVLDIGASTGGFTDCVLQWGAECVVCVDVGKHQLHSKLVKDPRVIALPPINARYLTPKDLPHPAYDLIVMDLSFISLTKVLKNIWPFLAAEGFLIALIKPQFEATKKEVDQGHGIIKDPIIHERILTEMRLFIQQLPGAQIIGCLPSAIVGTKGNQEFLISVQKKL